MSGEEAEDVTNIRVDVDVDAAETGSGARRLPADAEPYTMEPQTAQLQSASPRTLQDKLSSSDENTVDIPPSTNLPRTQPAEDEPSTLEPQMSVRSIDGVSVDRMREALAEEETLTSKSIVSALEISARESVVAWEEAKNLDEDSSVTVNPARAAHGQVETSPTAFTPVTLTAKRAPTMIDGAPPPAPSTDFDLAPTDLALPPGTQAPAVPDGIVPPTRDTIAESTERRMPPVLLTPSEPITVPTSSAVPLPPIVFQPPRPAAGAAPALEAKTAEDEPFGRSDPPPPTEAMATDDSVSFVSVEPPKTAKMPDPPPPREHKATLPMVERPSAQGLAFAETAPMSSSMAARFPDVRPGSAPSGSHVAAPAMVASLSARPAPSAREAEPPRRGRGKVVAIVLFLLVASGGASAFVVWKSGRWPGASAAPAPRASASAPLESASTAPSASASVAVAPSASTTASAKTTPPTPSASSKRRPRHWQPRPGQKGFDPSGI